MLYPTELREHKDFVVITETCLSCSMYYKTLLIYQNKLHKYSLVLAFMVQPSMAELSPQNERRLQKSPELALAEKMIADCRPWDTWIESQFKGGSQGMLSGEDSLKLGKNLFENIFPRYLPRKDFQLQKKRSKSSVLRCMSIDIQTIQELHTRCSQRCLRFSMPVGIAPYEMYSILQLRQLWRILGAQFLYVVDG